MDHFFAPASSINVKRKQTNVWHAMDMSAIHALWTVFNTDFIARSSRNYIESSLLSGGLVLSDSHLNATPGQDFQAFINEHFVPFYSSVIDWLYVVGFAPYTLTKDGKPRCVPFGLVQFKYLIDDDYEIHLGAFDEQNVDDPNKDVYFLVENMVGADGSIVSATAVYYTHRLFRDTLMRNTAIANFANARPPIYLVTATQRTPFHDADVTNVGEVDGLRASITQDGLINQNNIQLRVHENQEAMVNSLNARRSMLLGDNALKTRTDPFTNLQSYDRDLTNDMDLQPTIPLPMDMTPANVTQARPPDNLVATLNQQFVIAAGCYGMSLESIGLERGGGARSAETIQLENRVAQNTVKKFKNHFIRTLRGIYDMVWAESAGLASAELTVLFPATLDRPTMLDLFNKGIVSFDGLRNYLASHMDINPDAINDTFSPPLDAFKAQGQESMLELQAKQAQNMARLQSKLS